MNNNNNNNSIKPVSFFLGGKGENKEIFKELSEIAIDIAFDSRIENQNDEPSYFESNYFENDRFLKEKGIMKKHTEIVSNYLKDSIQFSSLKYVSHIGPDPLIPASIGLLSSLIHSQNNLIPHISNKTSMLEVAASNGIAKMIGYDFSQQIDYYKLNNLTENETNQLECDRVYPFSHITNGGTACNIEALWSTFWVKLIPLSLKNALINEKELESAKDLKIKLIESCPFTIEKQLIQFSNWELVNTDSDISVKLPYLVALKCNLSYFHVLNLIKKYHPITIGCFDFFVSNQLKCPVFLVPASSHYSFAKAGSLFGLGTNSIKLIKIQNNARSDIQYVQNILQQCIDNEIPVINVSALFATTQESAVDDIEQILSIRNHFRKTNQLNFDIHVDAALGGFFLSCVRDPFPIDNPPDMILFNNGENEMTPLNDSELNKCPIEQFDPELILGEYVSRQFKACKFADTVTIDGHKSGYVPFGCGILNFRNSKFKEILSNLPPYISGGLKSASVGVYGIDGSRAGHTASALYLANSLLRPTKLGYGRLLKRSILNSKLFFIKLLLLGGGFNFDTVMIGSNIPSKETLNYLKQSVLDNNGDIKDLSSIASNHDLLKVLSTIGCDVNVLCFSFNPILSNGQKNTNYLKFIDLNNKLVKKFGNNNGEESEIIFTSSTHSNKYGDKFITNIINSVGLVDNLPPSINDIKIPCLRCTLMNPFIGETKDGNYFNIISKVLKNEIISILNNK